MDYNKSFKNRANLYKYAIETYPIVLEKEFKTAIELCNIQSTDIVLNLLAGGTPLNKYFITSPKKYLEYETNIFFSNIPQFTFNYIPEKSNSINTIIILAGLHHSNEDERKQLYKECNRTLKESTGRLIIGDVIHGSKEAEWLNIFVNNYNSSGHNGLFWTEKDKTLIEQNGFTTDIVIKSYPWIFQSEYELIDFTRNLFGLDLANDEDILSGLNTYLCPRIHNNNIVIDWNLIYFISTKRQISPQSDQSITDIQQMG